MIRSALAFAFGAAVLAAAPAQAADGAKLFPLMCGGCHQPKSTVMAPSLAGVAGRKIASLTDYNYSAALKLKAGGVWTDQQLDTFLTSPAKFAPGTKMPASVAAAGDRTAIIAYLKTLH
jgi:cytochrome c2